jgi:hypothetical protein
VALLLELFEMAQLELPRQLRQAEQRKALQGVRRKACGRGLPLARWARLPGPCTPSRWRLARHPTGIPHDRVGATETCHPEGDPACHGQAARIKTLPSPDVSGTVLESMPGGGPSSRDPRSRWPRQDATDQPAHVRSCSSIAGTIAMARPYASGSEKPPEPEGPSGFSVSEIASAVEPCRTGLGRSCAVQLSPFFYRPACS